MSLRILMIHLLMLRHIYSYEYPFSTKDNTIIDGKGEIVRMKCVNWPGSMETLLPEGLQHNSIENIVQLIKEMNFNCVRLTYSIDVTLSSNLTVYQSLSRLQLTSAIQGFILNNPQLINATVTNVFDAVLDQLGQSNLLVLFDNCNSKASWCCSNTDGNGFWGDLYFDVQQWIEGLKYMAQKTIDRPFVVAMSLRNELRGPRENEEDWYRYVVQGILQGISSINPQLLVVVSGLNYDLDLTFIRSKPIQNLLPQSLQKKIVYEAHWYSWSGYGPTDNCTLIKQGIEKAWGFILQPNQSYTTPIWLTEFGTNVDLFTGDDQFIDCVKTYLETPLTKSVSWSYWVLVGTYYIRSGTKEFHDSFGLLTDDWKYIKSKSFIDLLSTL